jgi:molecular chaperone DnaJ
VILLEVQEDERFTRNGSDLLQELPITFGQAALGAEVDVPTIEGTARVTIPAGVQSGEILRLRGLGLPELNGAVRGDQLVRVIVWTPDELSGEQERILKQLREVESPAPEKIKRRSHKGFWSKVKEAFTGG